MFSRSFFLALLALSVFVQATPHNPFFNNHHKGGNKGNGQQSCSQSTVTVTISPSQQTGKNNEVRPVVTSSPPASITTSNGAGATNTAASGKGGNDGKDNNGGKDNNNGNGNDNGNNGGNQGNNNAGGGNGSNNGNGGNEDPQKSLTLDQRVIATGFAQDGQDPPVAGQVPSLISTNNFINYCLLAGDLPITNGKQIQTGSCNPSPIGMIPSIDNMPSCKFAFPGNFDTLKAGESFTIELNIQGMETGFFVNAQANYFAAPQQLNDRGQIKGHSHVVVEALESLTSKTPMNPKVFAFFKGLNSAAQGGKLTASVDKGLEAGAYRVCSINTAANHQPVIGPVAQHGSFDDCVYFSVTADGKPAANQGNAGNNNGNNNNSGNNGNANGNNGKDSAKDDPKGDSNANKGASSSASAAAGATPSASTSAASGKATDAGAAQNDGQKGNGDKQSQSGDNKQAGNNNGGNGNKQDDKSGSKTSASSPPASAPTPSSPNNKGQKSRRRTRRRL